MAHMDYYLIVTMCMSMLWGVFVLLVGTIIRFGLGQLINIYVRDVSKAVNLEGTVNQAGQNICPIEISPGNNIDLGDWSIVLGSIVIITGVIIIIFSVTGFVAGLQHNLGLLALVMLAIVVACFLQYYLLIITTGNFNSFHEHAQSQLTSLLRSEYDVDNKRNTFSKTMNAIMLTAQCCGIRGPTDFKNLTFVDEGNNDETVYFTVSPACCKRVLFNKYPHQAFQVLKKCAMFGYRYSQNINTQGCYSEVLLYFNNNYGTLIIVGLVVLALWEVIQMVLAGLIIFTPIPVRRASRKPTLIETVEEELELRPKKFVPYWKISSYMPNSVERVRSTEIW